MLVTVIVVVIVVLASSALAAVANRRRPDVPTAPRYVTPQQIDRREFSEPEAEWLFVLFSSQTCLSCLDARQILGDVDAANVHVQELDAHQHKPLHQRYRIDAVPTLVLADAEGVVRWSYLGAPPAEELHDVLVDIGVLEATQDDPGGTAVDFP